MAKKPVLLQIDKGPEKDKASDGEFLFQLQRGLLLSLKEEGLLSEMQLQYAEDKLNGRRCGDKQKQNGR